jgi:hypothetical protein
MGDSPTTRIAVKRLLLILAAACAFCVAKAEAPKAEVPRAEGRGGAGVLLVVGAAGEAEYASDFTKQVTLWQGACQQHQVPIRVLGLPVDADPAAPEEGIPDRQRLEAELAAASTNSVDPLWVVLIGHGTFDGKEARFNLRGPDITARELGTWLQPFRRPVVLINTASASAPFISALACTNRVVLSATRSGNELNATRFGRFLAEALADPGADLDQDGETSLLELFLHAAHRVADFYVTQGRLLTEHALVDDNGDGRGTPAEWFRGLRSTKVAEGAGVLDGTRARQFALFPSPQDLVMTAAQRERRDALELQVEALRSTKAKLAPDEYYRRLEGILLELARLQRRGSR